MESGWANWSTSTSIRNSSKRGESSQRMTLGAALVSENITAETLTQFIHEVGHEIYWRAETLATGEIEVLKSTLRTGTEKNKIVHEAREILKNPLGWYPKFWMIDYSVAECNAIQAVMKDAYIRCCQFHVIKVISSFEIDLSDTDLATKNITPEAEQSSDNLGSKKGKKAKLSNKADIKVPALVRKKIPQLFREL